MVRQHHRLHGQESEQTPASMFSASELAVCNMWPRYRSFSFSISPADKYSGLISFTTAWFDLLAS